ncbi:Cytochrome P450 86B1 [Phytophthora cinnamomi]|uniref:Cytochrome P450 86B1 n=1 Tax=Phytophthora cinnamomi TaxID=4785 RepID=UPI003559F4A6|nr:Cytochrome P450 86B1 [Phytophthora cinnamomi]
MTADELQHAEWLGVIERQQQEIELLRQELEAATRREGAGHTASRRGSDASSVASLAFSVLSLRDCGSELPMGSERYARICEKMEHMRAALVRKDAKLQKARAQRSEGQKTAARLRDALADMQSHTETQRAQFAGELATSQEAVDKAVEKAARALMTSDGLRAELNQRRELEAELREEIRVRCNALKGAEAVSEGLHKKLMRIRHDLSRKSSEMRSLQSEKNALQSALQAIQQELTAKRKCDSEWDELVAGKKLLQQRVSELETGIQQRNVQLDQQAKTIDQQNQQIQHLRDEQVLAERASVLERAEDQIHAQHLLKSNISLQFELQCGQVRIRGLEDQVRGLSETSQMLAEDMLQVKLTVAGRDQMLLLRGQKYSELATAYRGLSRHAQAIEQSERELVSVLIPTKKRLALLQDTLTRFCYELEGISKQMVVGRNREISLGRALREYGKRNRELQASVVAARQRLHSVANAFRNSEKRKEQAISANWNLKRDLVIERCQRTDLLQQCKDLESCLDSCQSSALESQTRAEGLEKDNGVLQHAVTQLVAYAQELRNSQQYLQRELTKLEITGKRQPAVYG